MYNYLLLILLLFLTNLQACCENSSSLTLNELIQQVVNRNPDLVASEFRIRAAALAISRVQFPEDPEIAIMSDENKFHKESEFSPMMKYELAQMIPFPGKLALRGKIAEQALNVAISEQMTNYWDLILKAKKFYYQLLETNLSIRINRQNYELANRFVEGALALYRSGTGAFADVVKAQTEAQMLNERLLMLEAEKETMIAMINVILDLPQENRIGEPEERFTPSIKLNYKDLETIALSHRPELLKMQAMVEEQRAMAKLAKRELYPDVRVGVMYERMNQDMNGHVDDAWAASVSFKVPIWGQQKQLREAREANLKATANQQALFGMQAMIRGQIRENLAKLRGMEERIILYENNLLPKSKQALLAFEARYRTGKGEFLMLIDTRRQLQEVELAYEKSRIEREIILAELERALGIRLEEIICR
jgi:outer membrane protein, heavy metal efflux system